MERRDGARRPRRVQVNFWERGSSKRKRGYSANISTGGMYIETNQLVSRGTRIRLEVCADNAGFMVEAVVARVNKSVQTLRPSGMGVRFLEIEELVSELLPEFASTAPTERQTPLPEGSYRLRFPGPEPFLAVYRRDLATGGLFIPTDDPPSLREVITVEILIEGSEVAPLRFQARVVHRLEPGGPDGAAGGNLMAGMGVELLSFDMTLKKVRKMVAELEAENEA
ncbi:MAG: hypothetical protein GY719_38370 [bacterium]|nr:hypothetical protein [bacterium]